MDRESGTVAERVVERVADSHERDALDLPPLYDAVDPDALESLVASMSSGEVSFVYAGHEVSVDSNGAVAAIRQPSRSPRAGITATDG